MPLTRRRLMHAAIGWPAVGTLQAASKEFWTRKPPAQWDAAEKQRLLWQSPWAREGTLRLAAEDKRVPQRAPVPAGVGGGVPGAKPNLPGSGTAVNSVPFGDPPPPPPPGAGKGEPPQFRALVRWESARPVHLAGGSKLPDETAEFYVIRLTGMPLMKPRPRKNGDEEPDPNLGILDDIKRSSRLERKNKNPIPCSHLLTGKGDAATELLLFFAHGSDPITLADKEVTLVSRMGPFQLAVRFPLKEMMFDGALAL